jgi:predicted permease
VSGLLAGDLRFAVQSLRRSPGFTLIAIITLGLGIGANTSMFSVANAYMLQPAPYADSEHLDRIYRATPRESRGGVSPADYLDLKSEMNGYGEIAAYGGADMSLSEPGKPAEMTSALRVSANLFETLGSTPRLGRSFSSDEETVGNHRVLIISDRYWQNHFGGDPRIIGRIVRVDGEPHEIVGVLPADFSDWRHLVGIDLFRPLGFDEKESRDRGSAWLRVVARRSTTRTRAQAAVFIEDFGRRLAADFPAVHAGTTWRILPIEKTLVPPQATPMIAMLVGLSGFVVLIACSNLANLLLARTMARARELALRAALGASRAQMLRPLFVESLLLAFGGGLCALVVALWTMDWMEVASLDDNGIGVVLGLDWRVLGWAFGACLFTAVSFGVVPALFALRLDPNRALKSSSRGITGDFRHQRFRQALIVAQFALAMVLLAGAGLFVRGLHELNNRRSGWESDRLITGNFQLPIAVYPGDEEILDFHRLALERLEALPGVRSATISSAMPFFGLAESRKYLVAGHEIEPGKEPVALINAVTPHYFETVGTRVLSGRTFDEADTPTSPRVFVINEAMAHGLFVGESPLGQRLARAEGTTVEWGEIVGVVDDVQPVIPDPITVTYQLYHPMAQEPRPFNEIAVRTEGIAPATVVDGIRATFAALDPDLPVQKLQPAEATLLRANYGLGVMRSMLSSLAVLGLGLASLGVYGVAARTVAQRIGEFGIRLALGAQVKDIVRLVLTSGAKLALIGCAIGLLGAFGVTRLISSSFPTMHTSIAPVLVGVTLLLIAIAQLACYMPARQASRINPIETLRAD